MDGCLGRWVNYQDGREFECEYENAPNCEDCVFGSCGGTTDPREVV